MPVPMRTSILTPLSTRLPTPLPSVSLVRGAARWRLPLASALFVFAFVTCGSHERSIGVEDSASTPRGSALFDSGADTTSPGPCVGLECDRVSCPEGGDTSLSGRVTAPNGTLPVVGAVVYVPNGALPTLPLGASCATCAAWLPERPVAITSSAADGTFTLRDVPVGANVPVVVQVGKWRRAVTVPNVSPCANQRLDGDLTRLPRNRSEGSMPRIALTTGACDDLGCILPKLGIDAAEIGTASEGDARAVHVYRGAVDPARAPRGAPPAEALWSREEGLGRYDMALLSCECAERLENKGPAANAAMTRYLDAGGRIFTTDYMYTWYRDSPSAALRRAIPILGGGHDGGHPVRVASQSVQGATFRDWLRAASPGSADSAEGRIEFESVFDNVAYVDPARAHVWATSSRPNAPSSPEGPRVISVEFPIDAAPAAQCGRAVHIDAHVNQASEGDGVGPEFPRSCSARMGPGEAALAFFLFHLAACVTPAVAAPGGPAPK